MKPKKTIRYLTAYHYEPNRITGSFLIKNKQSNDL
jgi:hypothetical protein